MKTVTPSISERFASLSLNLALALLSVFSQDSSTFAQTASTIHSPPSADENWDDRFTPNGTNGEVRAIAVSTDKVYAGGYFTLVDKVIVSNVAVWDSNGWATLGDGVDEGVYALAIDGTNVYVAGAFAAAGGVTVNHVAKWDGAGWSALGSGTNGDVYAMAVNANGEVFVGGYFTEAGGVVVNNIAKWDGNTWLALNGGVNNEVNAITIANSGNVYVGGRFRTAGGISANRIAKWDGHDWSLLGDGLNKDVASGNVAGIAIIDNDVYVAGDINTAGEVNVNGLARWDGSNWFALGGAITGTVFAVENRGNELFVGGQFTTINGVSAHNVAKWDGNSWAPLSSGVNSFVYAVGFDGSDVILGGSFSRAGNMGASGIAKWNGADWFPLTKEENKGLDNRVYAITRNGGDLYVGGLFSIAGDMIANRIAKWNGTDWSPLGSGLNGAVRTIMVQGSDVYVGGSFTGAGGQNANSIAKWDGSSWSALGNGMDGTVYAVAGDDNGNIYAGGEFLTADGMVVNNIARWDGNSWSAMAGGFDQQDQIIFAIAIYDNQVHVGGYGDPDLGGIFSAWDGQSWIDHGVDGGSVSVLTIEANNLYVGGDYEWVGYLDQHGNWSSTFQPGINKWDGSSWSSVGGGIYEFDHDITGISVYGNFVYVGGRFSNPGGVNASNIVRWDGISWSALGSGAGVLYNDVFAMDIIDNDIYVGGEFTTAGGKSSNYLAIWHEPETPLITGFCEDFEDGEVTGWTPLHPLSWTVTEDQGMLAYFLFDDHNPDNSALLGEYSVFENFEDTDFNFKCRAHSAENVSASNRPDIALVFEYRDDLNYSYAVFNKDFNHTKIWKVENGNRTQVAVSYGSVPVVQDETYHTFMVIRNGSLVEGFYDGTLVMSGVDPRPFKGRFGVGSKNDRAYFAILDINDSCASFPDGAVPVELTSFIASQRDNAVQLNWETATESNNFGFDVERLIESVSLDQRDESAQTTNHHWQKIAFVKAHGTTSEPRFYGYTDNLEHVAALTATTIHYRLKQIDFDGAFEYHGPIEVTVGQIPERIVLAQNYPNPFNPVTTIEFAVPESGRTTLKLVNSLGQEVATLVDKHLEAGVAYSLKFQSRELPSGVYYYTMRSGGYVATKKMVLMR